MARLARSLCCILALLVPGTVWAGQELQVYVYPSFVSGKGLRVEGRVLKKSKYVRTDRKKVSRWRMFVRSFRRFTRRAPGLTPLKVQWKGQKRFITTDSKGYFRVLFKPMASRPTTRTAKAASRPATKSGKPTTRTRPSRFVWPASKGALPDGVSRVTATTLFTGSKFENATGVGFAVRPVSRSGLSVVSDIDDTLISSKVSSKLKMLKETLLKDFRQVKIFKDAQTFLRTVLSSPDGHGGGAMHYLTGSPVNLFDRLGALFQLRKFPAGSMHMKYLSGSNKTSLTDHQGHKLGVLRRLLKAYPKRKFLLLGDSTEQDAVIYRRIRKEFPTQVAGIFIHNVTNVTNKDTRFQGVTLFRSYKEALRFALQQKLILTTR